MKLPAPLSSIVGCEDDLPHLEEALSHPSYANERKRGPKIDYQRLEFLGDAVIQLGVSEALMADYPDAREGELSFMRSAIVSTEALADYARSVDLGDQLLLGRGADGAGERLQGTVLADALEAVVGAIYLDLGGAKATLLTRRIYAAGVASRARPGLRDPKSELQEKVQAKGGATPRYQLVGTSGPDHQREFEVEVEALGRTLGRGRGRSKKAAEQAAARAGLSIVDGVDAPAEGAS